MSYVNPNTYLWNPVAVRESLRADAPAITPILLHALLDAMWLSEERTQIVSPAAEVRILLGLDPDTYRQAIEALMEAGHLTRSYTATGTLLWVSPLLVATRAQLQEDDELARRRDERRRAKEAESERRLSLRRRVGGSAPTREPRVKYLTVAERQASGFTGWLPTINFDRNGQVVFITEPDIQDLAKRYPGQDVTLVLGQLLKELLERPARRTAVNRVPALIERWLKGEGSRQRPTVNLTAIGQVLEDLPEFE